MPDRVLTDYDYGRLAGELSVEPESLMAVGRVESRGEPFYPDGFPTILFERHKFYKHARRDKRAEWVRLYPAICNPNVTPRGGYGSHGDQRVKFSQAFRLDPDAAMMACSWGAFQELGENYDDYGFHSVGEFVDVMKSGVAGHLEIFAKSIRHRGLIDELQRHDWAGFARNYNGSGYHTFNYDGQMRDAYALFKHKHIDWQKVMAVPPPAPAFTDDEIEQLAGGLGPSSTEADPAGSQNAGNSVLPNGPASSVGSSSEGAAGLPEAGSLPGSAEFMQSRTVETAEGTKTVGSSVTTPAGDAPDVPPSHWYDVEDWKPWAKRWASRIWTSVSTLTIPTGGGFGFAAINAGEHWWIWAIAGVGVVLLFGGLGIFATLVVVGIWLWQNRGIPASKIKEMEILADPNMKNVGLNFIKK